MHAAEGVMRKYRLTIRCVILVLAEGVGRASKRRVRRVPKRTVWSPVTTVRSPPHGRGPSALGRRNLASVGAFSGRLCSESARWALAVFLQDVRASSGPSDRVYPQGTPRCVVYHRRAGLRASGPAPTHRLRARGMAARTRCVTSSSRPSVTPPPGRVGVRGHVEGRFNSERVPRE